MSDYTPKVFKGDVERIIRRDYSESDESAVWELLMHYGSGESYRVYAAALKEGAGELDRLRSMIDLANSDYRDLLVAAEYPAQKRNGCLATTVPSQSKLTKANTMNGSTNRRANKLLQFKIPGKIMPTSFTFWTLRGSEIAHHFSGGRGILGD